MIGRLQIWITGLLLMMAGDGLIGQIDQTDMATDLAEALTFTKYPTYQQYDSMMHYFAATYPDICRVDTFGTSIQGRLLLAVKISDNVHEEEDEPAFLYTSTMHGDELVGYILMLRLIDFLLKSYGADPEVDRIVNELEVWINPLSNPDGSYYFNRDSTVATSIRGNTKGVDLNRDYPDAKDGDPDDTTGVQKENRHMMLFMQEHGFNMSANLHSGAEVVNYPWDHKYALHPDDDWYRFISREYADNAQAVDPMYMISYDNGITNGAEWYIIYGGRQDYVNYYLRGREVSLELSFIKRVPSENLEGFWVKNQWSLINYMAQARYGIHGKVTDSRMGEPVEAKIVVLNHDNDSSWVRSNIEHGSFYRYLKEGVYDLAVSAKGYISDTVKNVEVVDYQTTTLAVELFHLPTGEDPIPEEPVFTLYPNPAHDRLTIGRSEPFGPATQLEIFTITGKSIYSTLLPEGAQKYHPEISQLEGGVYILRIREGARSSLFRLIKY